MSGARTIIAGAGRSDITPPVGSPHLNWGAATHQVAAGIDMELYSTALYLSDGASEVVLLNLDVATLTEGVGSRSTAGGGEGILSLARQSACYVDAHTFCRPVA